MPEEDTLVITDSDTNTFRPITYTKPGDYVYTVTQVAGSEQDFIYDDAVIRSPCGWSMTAKAAESRNLGHRGGRHD